MTRDPEELLGREALGDALERLWTATRPDKAVGGWATVELDRAEREVGAALRDLGPWTAEVRPDEPLLGARCRLMRFPGDRDLLLLEPSTEGRLAASLARHGEGSVALWLQVDAGAVDRSRDAGFVLSREARGPLGVERLVAGGPAWGPHLLLVVTRPTTGTSVAPATIER